MKPINWGRVVLGGIVAGVLINVCEYLLNEVVLRAEMEESMKALGKSMPTGGTVIPVWILWSFVMGIAAVWLYAAIRPRYGAGPMTAVKAGVAVWVLAQLLSCIAFANLGIFPLNGLMLGWTLIEAVLATVAGAWVYREDAA